MTKTEEQRKTLKSVRNNGKMINMFAKQWEEAFSYLILHIMILLSSVYFLYNLFFPHILTYN